MVTSRQPGATVLYRTVETYLKIFLAHTIGDARLSRRDVPCYGQRWALALTLSRPRLAPAVALGDPTSAEYLV